MKLALAVGYASPDARAIEILKQSGEAGAKIVQINQVDSIDEWLPKMLPLRPPPDPASWVRAWNEVKAS